MSTVALRTALIWNDEVMDDVVIENPTKITVGASGKPTFIVPDIGLPPGFAIVRPGNRGYLLTLGERMRGTICIDGQQKDVRDFVQRGGDGDGQGGFRATPISGRDWGVVDLDESAQYKLFFQFVPVEDAQPFFTKQVIMAGTAGWLISCLGLAMMWFFKGEDLDESLFRGAMIASGAIAIGGLLRWIVKQDGESQASLAFSAVLHAALLFMTYQLYDGSNAFSWPGSRSLTGNYLVTRLEPEKPPEPPKPVAGAKNQEENAPKAEQQKVSHAATKGAEGAAGGKGDKERYRDPSAKNKPVTPPVALMEDKNRRQLDQMLQKDMDLGQFGGLEGPHRDGTLGHGDTHGSGVGVCLPGMSCTGTTKGSMGKGTGGNGFSDNDIVRGKGKIDTGQQRAGGTCTGPNCGGTGARPVQVAMAGPSDADGGLTAEQIDKVVRARQGLFRACYTRELQKSPGLGGKLVMKFSIGTDGSVKSAGPGPGSTLSNDAVSSCVQRNLMGLKFPAASSPSNVKYPFGFSQGAG